MEKIIEEAKTSYKVLDKNSICSLVELKPITGRKHQLKNNYMQLEIQFMETTNTQINF